MDGYSLVSTGSRDHDTVARAIYDWGTSTIPVTLGDIEARTRLPRRYIRSIIKQLIEDYRIPIGSLSTGKNGGGYFFLSHESDRLAVIAELKGRINSLRARIRAIEDLSL